MEAATLHLDLNILEAIDQAVIVTDLNGTIRYWNAHAETLYGWPAAEAIGHNIVDVTPTQQSHDEARTIMERLVRGEKWSGTFAVQRRDGSTFTAQVTDAPVFDSSGRLAGIVGVSSDITAREQLEAQLREQAETIATINRVGQLLAAELNQERLVQLVTDAATELTGAQFGALFYNVIDARGESYQLYTLSGVPREAFASFPMPRNTAIFGPTFRGEGVIRLDDVMVDPRYGHNPPYKGMPPGHLPVRSYLAVPIVSRVGDVYGGLFFGHSEPGVFTQRAEQVAVGLAAQTAVAMDNARLYEQAQQAIAARDHFLAMAAHELKTPVTSILGYAQMLDRRMERDERVSERYRASMRTLAEQTMRLNKLVSSLFDLSRVHTGQLDLERAPVDLSALVSHVVDTYEASLERHQLRYEPWNGELPCVVIGDELRLEQALHNLLENAVKYSPDGGEIRVAVSRRVHEVCITVSDQGIGIPADAMPQLFTRFFRATNVRESAISGLGLGLYVIREVIEGHGGRVEVDSRPAMGTTFRLLLPLAGDVDLPSEQSRGS